jgi:hypothetical protein
MLIFLECVCWDSAWRLTNKEWIDVVPDLEWDFEKKRWAWL